MANFLGISQKLAQADQTRIDTYLFADTKNAPAWYQAGSFSFLFQNFSTDLDGFIFHDNKRNRTFIVDGYIVHDSGQNTEFSRHVLNPEELADLFAGLDIHERCSELAGLFTLIIWDENTRQLFCIRDQCGSKPLYVAEKQGYIVFASTIRAIHWTGLIDKRMNHHSIPFFLAMISVPDPLTAYETVIQVPSGHYLAWKEGRSTLHRYWQMFARIPDQTASDVLMAKKLREVLSASVWCALPANGVCGSFLSGGHDTSTIVGLASEKTGCTLKTFTLGYGDDKKFASFNEFQFARTIAQMYGTEHHEYNVGADILIKALPELTWHLNSPSGDALNRYFSISFAAKYLDIVLSGLGGDEIFIGSMWYKRLFRLQTLIKLWKNMPASMQQIIRAMIGFLPEKISPIQKFRRLEALSHTPINIYMDMRFLFKEPLTKKLFTKDLAIELDGKPGPVDLVSDLFQTVNSQELISQFMYLLVCHEIAHIMLRDLSTMSHAHSIETRSPFLDRRVLDTIASIPVNSLYNRGTLRYMQILACHDLLPKITLQRKKQSFIIPLALWARNELSIPINRLLSKQAIIKRGFFNPEIIEQLKRDFFLSRQPIPYYIWNLALLELWCRINIDNDFNEPPQANLDDFL
ncbi:hypothetical protein JXQ70_14935 [bacterium]|nr:hypothetical protein [bacterium]